MTHPSVSDQHRHARAAFERTDVVSAYAGMTELWPCEQVIVDRYVHAGDRVLDLGVGTGRTTPALAEKASRYVGLDYSEAMVHTCRSLYPGLEFVCDDATDLSRFADSSFDVVVFSFNGIDCLHPDEARFRCISEMRRVLEPGGLVILSAHNPFVVLRMPARLRGAPLRKKAGRLRKAALQTSTHLKVLARSRDLWRGSGYYLDPTHGGLELHAATRRRVVAEFDRLGFSTVGRPIPLDWPRRTCTFCTPFYQYVFRKD